MRFAYSRFPSTQFVHPLGGWWRDYPMCDMSVGWNGVFIAHSIVFDTGSDDSIFPIALAQQLGIDLSNAPTGQAQGVGGGTVTFHYAQVLLRLSDGTEHAEWSALVGFAPIHMRRGLLGRTGFHQFFDVTYRGEAREVVLTPNGSLGGAYLRP
jgi:hypothetical protein